MNPVIPRARFRAPRALLLAVGAALLAWTAQPARADLVWTAENGWQVQGGVLAPFFGGAGDTASALEAMNKAKTAQEAGSYWTALDLYDRVIHNYPSSIFAPEAMFQEGIIYTKRHQFDKANKSFQDILSRYPDYPRFNAVIGKQYINANEIQIGKRPRLWGFIPWFKDYSKAIDYYEELVKSAPYSEYAPLALMNIATVARDQTGKPEVAIDALDRLINNYPQSMLAPDAYLELAATYSSLVKGAAYDQGSTQEAIRYYQDYLFLYRSGADVEKATENLNRMKDIYSRSQLILGDFYYYYRNSYRGALIYYNQAITLSPDSPAAKQARVQINKIQRGIAPPKTPYDWVFGRYKEPSLIAYEEQSQITNLASEAFTEAATTAFAETPGDEIVETVGGNGQVETYEGLAPVPFPTDISNPVVPPDSGFLTPVEQPAGPGPAPGQEPGGRPLIR